MDERLDASVGEVALEFVAARVSDHKEMPDVVVSGGFGRKDKIGEVAEGREVAGGQRAPPFVPAGQMGQKDREEGGLERIKAGVCALKAMDVALQRAVVSEVAQAFGGGVVRRQDRACVSQSTEVFGRIEAVGRSISEGGERTALVEGTVSLGGIGEKAEVELLSQSEKRFERSGLAVQMDREKGFGLGGDRRRHAIGVKEAGVRGDFDRDDRRTDTRDR